MWHCIPKDTTPLNHHCENLKSSKRKTYVGFEVFAAVVMKSTIFLVTMPCSLLKVNQSFGGTYHLLSTCFHAGFLLGLFFDPEDRGNMFLRNVG
jgi:hypothetical protein